MPLVFVHGVSVRNGPRYYENVAARDSLFRRFALDGNVAEPQKATILNPYWGKYGAKFAWNQASLPKSGIEELGPEDELPVILLNQAQLDEKPEPDTVLLEVARGSMEEVIDLLWAVSSENVNESEAAELADLAVRAVDYAQHNPHPAWLDRVSNDEQFLRELKKAIDDWDLQSTVTSAHDSQKWEVLGFAEVWERIKEGAIRIQGAVSSMAGHTLVKVARPGLHRRVAAFFGDVFVYLNERGTRNEPGLIVTEIVEQLEKARDLVNSEDEKLIVVAHSMGGNIVYDILTHFRTDIEVDVLVTVGSQVALFEEMKLFGASDDAIPANPKVDRVAKPANVGRWINVFDFNDVFGFATEGVFQDVKDLGYSTGKGLISAHGTYFAMPSFHERIGQRIRNAD